MGRVTAEGRGGRGGMQNTQQERRVHTDARGAKVPEIYAWIQLSRGPDAGGTYAGKCEEVEKPRHVGRRFMYDLELDMWECLLTGTKWQLMVQALQKLPNMTAGSDEEWSVARQFLRQRLAQRQRDRAEGSGGSEHERGKQTYTARG